MTKIINQIKRNPIKFDTVELFSMFAKEYDFNLNSSDDIDKFTLELNKSLKQNINPILLYGKRIEKSFAHIVSSLGQCKMIKQEDAGLVFINEDILIPDYRILLNDGMQFLVEVKNYNQKNPNKDYVMKNENYSKYLNYSKLMNLPLYFAIYWTKLRRWTLIKYDKFKIVDSFSSISIEDALRNNEMSILGDYLIGTKPPLKLKLYANKSKERKIIGSECNFMIDKMELYSDSKIIKDIEEQSIVWNLMLFGEWNNTIRAVLENNSDLIDYIEYIFLPDDYNINKNFYPIAYASGIITNQFFFSTSTKDGKLKNITPVGFDYNFGINISKTYKKKDLPLWIFHIIAEGNNSNNTLF